MLTNFKLSDHFDRFPKKGRVLVAPLNWGIGHATRCIPIIKQLQENGYTPIIASDGEALKLLQKVFPAVISYELPSYKVTYAKKELFFTIKLLCQIPKFIKIFREERKKTEELVIAEHIDTIISDNRFGVFNKEIHNIYITHQLRVKSGWSTFLSSKLHQKIITNFDECWVPDIQEKPNLSGDLSHNIKLKIPVTYIGILSQFQKEAHPKKYDVLILLSGPEPQRSILETKLLKAFDNTPKKVCFIKGVIEDKPYKKIQNNFTIYNYLLGDDLQKALNQSELVIARSGYSTIMDLAKLGKKAFFIPTPGQAEQEYLAVHLENQRIAAYATQKNFSISAIETPQLFTGF